MTALLLGATVLDLILGDPRWLPHPVRWIGSLISVLERCLFPVRRSAYKEFMMGCLLSLIVIFVCAGVCGLILHLFHTFSNKVAVAVEIIIGFYCLSARSLVDEAMNVYKKLREQDIVGAQKALAMIVGRDTGNLTNKEVICAAVETVAENITDGIVSPLFYLALGGPITSVAFKAVSTMDSMIGHKNERYRHFGTFAARLDDALNFIPARITAFVLIPTVAFIYRLDYRMAIHVVIRDRLKHESPNSAHGEAAMAGALGIRLGGGAFYNGEFSERPFLGDDSRQAEYRDISRAAAVAIAVTLITTALLSGTLFFIKGGRLL